MNNNIKNIADYFYNNKVLIATNGLIENDSDIIKKSYSTYKDIITYKLYNCINFICCPADLYNVNCLYFLYNYSQRCYPYGDSGYQKKPYDYIIYIDADCFITNLQNLYELFVEFKNGDYICSGVPEDNLLCHRHGPKYSINPFFSFYNMKKIVPYIDGNNGFISLLDKYNEDISERGLKRYLNVYDARDNYIKKNNINYDYTQHRYCNKDIHHSLFLKFLKDDIMYMYARDLYEYDMEATAVYKNDILNNENLVCIHSWFSRGYNTKPQTHKRLDNIYNYNNGLRK